MNELIAVYKKAKRTSLRNRILNVVIMSLQGMIAAGVSIYQLTTSGGESGISKVSSVVLFAIPLLIGVVLQFKFDVQAASAYAASLRLNTVIKQVRTIRTQKGVVDEITESRVREFLEQINGQLYGYHYGVSNIADILEGMPSVDLVAHDSVPLSLSANSQTCPIVTTSSRERVQFQNDPESHADTITVQIAPTSPKLARRLSEQMEAGFGDSGSCSD